MFYSPLRYPGGKNKLSKFIASICDMNDITGHYVEPYAGGASVALYLLLEGKVSRITINDYDRAIYAFWFAVLNHTEQLCRKIYRTEITVENWEKQKAIHNNREKEADLLRLGFATFFLNRTNRSGIIDGGPIGGRAQTGKYLIDCRFNKKELIRRIRLIAAHKKQITLCNLDALELVSSLRKEGLNKDTIFYFDPPYYLKGPSLYLSHYKHGDHTRVGEEIAKITKARWIVSYDNTPEIKKIYEGFDTKEYTFYHTAHSARIGKEVLFYSDRLKVPITNTPTKF